MERLPTAETPICFLVGSNAEHRGRIARALASVDAIVLEVSTPEELYLWAGALPALDFIVCAMPTPPELMHAGTHVLDNFPGARLILARLDAAGSLELCGSDVVIIPSSPRRETAAAFEALISRGNAAPED